MTDAPQNEPKKSGALKWILGCLGCAFFATVLVIGGFALLAYGVVKATEPAAAATRDFLAKTTAGDVPGAYGCLHSKFKETLSQETLGKMITEHPEYMQVTDSTFNNRSNMNGLVRLQGTVVTKAGPTMNCLFKLLQEGDAWKLMAFKITPEPISDSD